MLVVVVLGVMGAIATPNLRAWAKSYQLKSAANELYSHFQLAKVGAVRQNRSWTLVLNPNGISGYEIRNGSGAVVKRVNLSEKYKRDVVFGRPDSGPNFNAEQFTLRPNGTVTPGAVTPPAYIYLTNTERANYYRIGFDSTSGLPRLQKWSVAQTQWN